MCGIGGILYSGLSEDQLRKKLSIIEQIQIHRGPDDQNIWIKEQNGLCHQRLSIIDLKSGKQPITDSFNRFVLTFNGEIYNFEELRKELESKYVFKSNSDSEVVLAAYIVLGKACLNKFIGMFSFFIWDSLNETGFAARDLLGVKPFVYAFDNGVFIFASEVKAILPILSKKPIINEYALAETIIAPSLSGVTESLFREIHYLQAGCYLEVSKGRVQESCYSHGSVDSLIKSDVKSIEDFHLQFRKSVAYSLKADVKLGCFLSGGLDSSYIAAQVRSFHDEEFNTYGISFDNHNDIVFSPETIVNSNDKPYTDLMVQRYQLNHTWVTPSNEELLNSINTISQTNDRIGVWEQEIAQHFLSQRASKDVKAILVGDAADEMNYGYFFLLNQDNDLSSMAISNLFGGKERRLIINPNLDRQCDFYDFLHEKYNDIAGKAGCKFSKNKEERLLATSSLIKTLWLGRLLHNGDIHTMKHSLEARVPFANQNLYEISRLIHPELGFKDGTEKYIVREAAKGVLIDEIRLRKKSALPRDPRLGRSYQQILITLLSEKNPFVDTYLNRSYLNHLASFSSPISEQMRMMIFNAITVINWSKNYAI